MDRITIMGVGPVGASMGLALKRAGLKKTEVIGVHDDLGVLSEIEKIGALDWTTTDLALALPGSDMIILAGSLSETKSELEVIGPLLSENCVITDIGMCKVSVAMWARENLLSRNFVGGRPLIPVVPHSLEKAREDLFDGVYYCIAPTQSADENLVKSVVGFVELLGAIPIFMDSHEHDSYTAAVLLLPYLVSCSLLAAAKNSLASKDVAIFSSGVYKELVGRLTIDPIDIVTACLESPDAMVHWIDEVLAEMTTYRELIKSGGDTLLGKLTELVEQCADWESVFLDENSVGVDLPNSSHNMASMVFGHYLLDRYRDLLSIKSRFVDKGGRG